MLLSGLDYGLWILILKSISIVWIGWDPFYHALLFYYL